ncbi:MAG: hypothetical protein Aurels2KO_54110 [Aureliella sp.]
MSSAARTVFAMGGYLLLVGGSMLLAPAVLLGPFGIDVGSGLWVRMGGMFTIFLGMYYLMCARQELTYFFQLTVYIRFLPVVFFSAFVLFDLARWPLVLFGIFDLATGVWTALALRSDSAQRESETKKLSGIHSESIS